MDVAKLQPSPEEWYPRLKVENKTRKGGFPYAFFLNESRSGVRYTDQPLGAADDSNAYESNMASAQLKLNESQSFAHKTATELVLSDKYYEQPRFLEDAPIYDIERIRTTREAEQVLMQWESHERDLPSHYVSIRDAVNIVFGFDINNEMIEFITRVSRLGTSVFETQAWLSMLCYRSAPSGGRPGKGSNQTNQTNQTNKRKRGVYDIGGWVAAAEKSSKKIKLTGANAISLRNDHEDAAEQDFRASSPFDITEDPFYKRLNSLEATRDLSKGITMKQFKPSSSPEIQLGQIPAQNAAISFSLRQSIAVSRWLRLQLPTGDLDSHQVVRAWLQTTYDIKKLNDNTLQSICDKARKDWVSPLKTVVFMQTVLPSRTELSSMLMNPSYVDEPELC